MEKLHKLAAMMFTDIVGYPTFRAKDEQKALQVLHKKRDTIKLFISQFNGEWHKEMGDGTLSSFGSVVDAVNCAVEIQDYFSEAKEFKLRIGIHIGDIVVEEGDVFGDGINVASRLEELAEPGGICISGRVYDDIQNKPDIKSVFLGNITLDNISRPIHVYAVAGKGMAVPSLKPLEAEERVPAKVSIPSHWIKYTVFCIIVFSLLYFLYMISFAEQEKISITVEQFENLSGDPEQDLLIDSMANEILIKLSLLPELHVIPESKLKGFRNIWKKSNYRLGASVHRYGDSLQFIQELIRAKDDSLFWYNVYDRKMKDLSDIQKRRSLEAEISSEIVKALDIRLFEEDKDAKELYAMGQIYWNQRNEAGYNNALYNYGRAINKDSTYALAYVGIADVYNRMGFHSIMPREEAYPRAKDAASKALNIDGELAEAYASLGWISLYYDWDFSAAKNAFEKAIEFKPTCKLARLWYRDYYMIMGQWDEAIEETKRYQMLETSADEIFRYRMITYIIAKRYDTALELFNRAVQVDPNKASPYDLISRMYVQQGQYDRALDALKEARKLSGNDKFKKDIFCLIYALSGDHERAKPELEDLIKEEHSPTHIALIYAAMGDNDEAFKWLDKAYEETDSPLLYINSFPEWDRLRDDSRFVKLLRDIGFKQ
ncbi:tetratricopeptide repeat protein [Candidatus Latescibacterota bacterium]